MLTPQMLESYLKAEPFRPFRVYLASGRTFDVRHPELVKILKSSFLIFKPSPDAPELPEAWDSVSLMLSESISHLDSPVQPPR
jgi:hypothetical protein